MKHILDIELNLYVIKKSILPKERISEIEYHLSFCDKCRQFYDEMKDFYASFDNDNNIQTHQKSDSVFILKPFEIFKKQDSPKLAASNNVAEALPYDYVRTYTSSKDFVMIRVLHKKETHEKLLYLICDDMERVANAVVNLQNTDTDYVTNENGLITLKNNDLESIASMTVFLPIAKYSIKTNEKGFKKISRFKGNILEISGSSDFRKINVAFAFLDSSAKHKIIVLSPDREKVYNIFNLTGNSLDLLFPANYEEIYLVITERM